MSYRDIPENKILKFPATPGFKGWKDHFTEDSITHPAKMNLNLLRWILKTYTSEGDVVLDPMAGTGSTIVLASLLGRHGVAVEYEPRFCEMIRENIKRTSRQSTLTPKGRMTCIQGDARELSKLLKESDVVITSPPYSGSEVGKSIRPKRWDKIKDLEGFKSKKEWREGTPPHYSDDPQNIGNLPHGDVEAIVTSPPYGEAQSGGGIATKGYDGPKHSPTDLVGKRSYMPDKFEGEENISRLKYGEVDTVVTSPPYEGSVPAYDEKWLEEHWDDESDSPKHKTMRFGRSMRGYPKKVDSVISSPPYGNRLADEAVQDGDEDRISYRQAIDSIVTSPPYEESLTGGGQVDKEGFTQGHTQGKHSLKDGYSSDEDNIGNLKSESYLEAMLQVYRECHKVLKSEGIMVLVTKNFIRDKQVVRLDLDTIKLCEAAGFSLSDRWYFKLPTKSFWRILYRRKYPDVPEVEYEDVLTFTKEADE